MPIYKLTKGKFDPQMGESDGSKVVFVEASCIKETYELVPWARNIKKVAESREDWAHVWIDQAWVHLKKMLDGEAVEFNREMFRAAFEDAVDCLIFRNPTTREVILDIADVTPVPG